MELSVREARARFATVLAAAERGERVTITKNGKAVAELGPPATPATDCFSWERLAQTRRQMGLDQYAGPPLDEAWRERFDDPQWTRDIFGPDYYDDDPEVVTK